MDINVTALQDRFLAAQRGKRSRHSAADRLRPSLLQYDYLALSTLSSDVSALIAEAPAPRPGCTAIDVGSSEAPYASILSHAGYAASTLDISTESGADYIGTVEETGLADSSFDLILCTQVLEHCEDPWRGMREMYRILKPGGHLVLSVPHVWFYHPHPADNWRFTQEGVVRLCKGSGFELRRLRSQGGSLLTLMQVGNFLLYGVCGRLGAPVFAMVNLVGKVLDGVIPNELFCHNFACLAQRPSV